jgi:PAS domain S-box-containing protein
VLSIEDNLADAVLIQEMLADATGLGWNLPTFAVEHVSRLTTGLDRLDEGGMDVVLSDLDLPDSQASETFGRIHNHAPDVPIVVLTGRQDESLAQQTVRAGAQDYIFKREMSGSLLAHALIYAIERKEAERALRQSYDSLEQRVAERTAALVAGERALRHERDRAQRYLNIAPSIIIALDREGSITLLNEMGGKILVCDPSSVIGLDWFSTFIPAEDREAVREIFGHLMGGDVQAVEYVESAVVTGSGDRRIIRWHNTLLRDESGAITGLLSSGEDITEQRQVAWMSRMKAAALDTATHAIAMADLTATLTYVNAAFLDLWGYDDEAEILGRSALAFWQVRGAASDVVVALQEEGHWEGKLVAERKDGVLFDVRLSATMVRHPETGEAVGMMASFMGMGAGAR